VRHRRPNARCQCPAQTFQLVPGRDLLAIRVGQRDPHPKTLSALGRHQLGELGMLLRKEQHGVPQEIQIRAYALEHPAPQLARRIGPVSEGRHNLGCSLSARGAQAHAWPEVLFGLLKQIADFPPVPGMRHPASEPPLHRFRVNPYVSGQGLDLN
jgi:hypothetical protein